MDAPVCCPAPRGLENVFNNFFNQGVMRMNKMQKITGIAIAAAAAGMFSMVTVGNAFADDAKVHCANQSSCKGQNDCKGAKNDCKGHGACKGQGVKDMSKADCDKATAAKK
jgi:hypothetical protein